MCSDLLGGILAINLEIIICLSILFVAEGILECLQEIGLTIHFKASEIIGKSFRTAKHLNSEFMGYRRSCGKQDSSVAIGLKIDAQRKFGQ